MIALRNDAAIERFLDILTDKPAAVFWSWPDGEQALFKHLRKHAMMEIPRDDLRPDDDTHETVLFRHADANVMVSLLQILDLEQYAQLFGPAAGLVMHAPDFGLRKSPRPSGLPAPPKPGFVRLSHEQMDALRCTQLDRSRLKVMRTLRKGAPNETMHLSDAQLREIVLFSERQGEALGIRSEKAHAKWAYLNLVTKGKLIEQDGVLDYMRDGKARPDKKAELMLRSVVLLAKHQTGSAR